MEKFSLEQFLKKYSSDDKCLDEIFSKRYPQGVSCAKCERVTKYYKIRGRKAYSCEFCRTQISPLSGTIFEKSSVSLQLWLYAMFIMVKTRSGISAKQLQRELGVSYKTAHRMFKRIRLLMEGEPSLLNGIVEVDETFIGGKAKNRARKWIQDKQAEQKEVVMGMLQRKGRVYLKHIPNTGKLTLLSQIKENINPKAVIYTDHYLGYKHLKKYGYNHDWINHEKGFVSGDIHTQGIENVWSHLKRGIYGVYRHVSKEYLQNYVNEYAWRYNNRELGDGMFEELLSVASSKVVKTF